MKKQAIDLGNIFSIHISQKILDSILQEEYIEINDKQPSFKKGMKKYFTEKSSWWSVVCFLGIYPE